MAGLLLPCSFNHGVLIGEFSSFIHLALGELHYLPNKWKQRVTKAAAQQSNTQHDLKVKPAFSSAYTRASWSINSLVIGQIDRRSWIGIRQNCSPKLVWFRRLLSFEIAGKNDPKGVIYSLLMGFFLRDLSSKKAGFLVFLAYLGGLRRLLEVSRSRGGRRPEEDAPRPPKSLL
ncbi:hypothetical protein MTR_1g051065 [Medicago truncatula]|uniref:Uncharacterized protein n=1 Tax=Medicago truncatula TaxID=3880 RepID=A0A072VJ59_MEDTR|nr:hypothetical protein MTR_1g051065 [Medicago truncatula]